ncbi:MAG: radical SAM protein [Spirochaetaceae bacterium]|jgi:histidinol dehydrogenase|nr:radical SAM protein [Spirochaetaceae bacterium]
MNGKAEGFRAGPVENHREREKGALVYPVYSRRSGGLSIGINLFPDRKSCSFDCPYCEVFPFSRDITFSTTLMEEALEDALAGARAEKIPVRDISFSGNGEPSLSPHFAGALETAARVRGRRAPEAALVLITNGTGLLDKKLYDLLRDRASGAAALRIWLKLDAGTPDWYARINRSAVDYDRLTGRIRLFVTEAPADIQTMICAVDGRPPPPEEAAAWEKLAVELAVSSRGRIRSFQLYGKARPAPEDPLAEALPAAYPETRAESLRRALKAAGANAIPVEVFP